MLRRKVEVPSTEIVPGPIMAPPSFGGIGTKRILAPGNPWIARQNHPRNRAALAPGSLE